MVGTLGLLFVLVCLMRLGLSVFQASWLVFSLMVAYRLISILTDLEFWAVAARLYNVQQSKRLFSLIGSGEVTARILGAFLGSASRDVARRREPLVDFRRRALVMRANPRRNRPKLSGSERPEHR